MKGLLQKSISITNGRVIMTLRIYVIIIKISSHSPGFICGSISFGGSWTFRASSSLHSDWCGGMIIASPSTSGSTVQVTPERYMNWVSVPTSWLRGFIAWYKSLMLSSHIWTDTSFAVFSRLVSWLVSLVLRVLGSTTRLNEMKLIEMTWNSTCLFARQHETRDLSNPLSLLCHPDFRLVNWTEPISDLKDMTHKIRFNFFLEMQIIMIIILCAVILCLELRVKGWAILRFWFQWTGCAVNYYFD